MESTTHRGNDQRLKAVLEPHNKEVIYRKHKASYEPCNYNEPNGDDDQVADREDDDAHNIIICNHCNYLVGNNMVSPDGCRSCGVGEFEIKVHTTCICLAYLMG